MVAFGVNAFLTPRSLGRYEECRAVSQTQSSWYFMETRGGKGNKYSKFLLTAHWKGNQIKVGGVYLYICVLGAGCKYTHEGQKTTSGVSLATIHLS